MKTIIIYHSKTGFSQRYAQWLAEALKCSTISYRERKGIHWENYDTVILIDGLHAGSLPGLRWLKRQPLKGKRVAAVAVGCAPVGSPGQSEDLKKLLRGTEIQGFYCQGGLAYDHMGAVDRAMMAGLRTFLKGKPEMAEMLAIISQSFDGSKPEYLDPVIQWAK